MKKIKAFFSEKLRRVKESCMAQQRFCLRPSTRVVLVSTVLFALFFGVVDFLLMRGLFFIF